ncbi:tripartite tricarboxylate transporter TctB family protein [Zafaria sp. Z1313]|uniref:tripartite tricarboxylate transporter TctB family protein n=1 Tax=unclassified Zafaria TaxID=2828765 RepID=UPI002E762AE8|nr:tripartite tricarboxylate transporter TctB family protein [Zafaria sp. J156]MEE1621885.1 tripartite tricarboxylate transporter TctB family protein [Zafaria sp. J156]
MSATETNTVRITGFWSGRSELIVPALVLVLAGFLTYGTATMEVLGNSVPGPQFFPTIVCVLLYVVAFAHAFQVLRTRRFPDADDDGRGAEVSSEMLSDLGDTADGRITTRSGTRPRATGRPQAFSDWKTLGMVVGAVALFNLMLPVAGWILAATVLFWVVCRALGSKRPLFDLSVSLLFASAVQLAFNAGLGLNLPAGFLEGLL